MRRHARILDHVWDAIRAGEAKFLHIDREHARAHRRAARRGISIPVWAWPFDPVLAPQAATIGAAYAEGMNRYLGPTVDRWLGSVVRKKIRVRRNGRWRIEARGPVFPAVRDLEVSYDGDLNAVLETAPGASLVASDPETGVTLASGQAISITVCGQRVVRLRVVAARPGRFAVSITQP